jgi:hypothetical protein
MHMYIYVYIYIYAATSVPLEWLSVCGDLARTGGMH